jgi:hypothetical protein
MEKNGDSIHALYFDSPKCKYGGPNDEAHGGHPLAKYGLGLYGLFEIENSPWVYEMMIANRVHARHSDSLLSNYRHVIAHPTGSRPSITPPSIPRFCPRAVLAAS